MILINFAHPLTGEQRAQMSRATGQQIDRMIEVPTQFDLSRPFEPQLEALMAGIPLTAQEWQTAPILVIPPSLSAITALLLAELHGRMGYFPAHVRTRPIEGDVPQRFEFAEILNLQGVRDRARAARNPS